MADGANPAPSVFDRLDLIEEWLRRRPVGLIADVDGTISEIAPAPEDARVGETIRATLRRLAERLDLVAAVSGRPAAEVHSLVGVPEMVYVGNHGLERWVDGQVVAHPAAAEHVGAVRSALEELRRVVVGPGLVFEDKGVTASIHYRLAPDRELARRSVLEALGHLAGARGLRVTEGRMVVELRPPVAVDKGSAVRDLLERHRLSAALYLGDDRTDLDAFRALRSWRAGGDGRLGVAVAVLSREGPTDLAAQADVTVSGVAQAERLLRWIAERG